QLRYLAHQPHGHRQGLELEVRPEPGDGLVMARLALHFLDLDPRILKRLLGFQLVARGFGRRQDVVHDPVVEPALAVAALHELADLVTGHDPQVVARDKIGKFMERGDCERWLNDWIMNYVLSTPETAGDELKAQKPLQDARVEVKEVKGKPGHYQAIAWLRPHFQLEALTVSMRLVGEVPKL